MREGGPAVSVVIPARNAEGTLGRALESLLGQSDGSFEAIVVENGSADRTAEVARAFELRDPRVRLERRAVAGVSAARNAGIALARGEWLLFLDADDTIEPDTLALLLEEARREPRPDAAVCGWVRVAPDGTRFDRYVWKEPDDAFESLAVTCAFAIHCCLVRRRLVSAAGGFDESLTTCEDWDLWLRLARMGARFRTVDRCLAHYHALADTASLDGRRMLLDGLQVIDRAHAPDPRVERPDPRLARGRDPVLRVPTRLAYACYAAGLVLGGGDDGRPLLAELGDDSWPDLDAETVAWHLYAAAPLRTRRSPDRWAEVWPLIDPGLDPFLTELETRAAPGLAKRARRELENLVLRESGAPPPLTIGTRHAVRIDLARPVETIELPRGIERLVCTVEQAGEPLGHLELPVCDGRVPAGVLADALAAEFFWPLLGRFFERGIYAGPGGDLHDRIGWETFLQELWGKPGWPELRFSEPKLVGEPAARECRAAPDGWLRVEVSEELPDVRPAGRTLHVEATVAGAPLGMVELPASRGRVVRAQALRAAITNACGLELAIAAVREALIGRPLPEGVPLRDLLRAAAMARRPAPARAADTNGLELAPDFGQVLASAAPNGEPVLVLPRHAGPIRGPASRRAALPVAAAGELARADAHVLTLGAPPARVLYEPGLVWRAPGRGRMSRAARRLRRTRGGRVSSGGAATDRLPILMYHRIADSGPAELARYRTSPAAFEEQLGYLRRAGYHSITLDDWRGACERRRPLPGRAVLLTFDDGYLDFAENAWPLLERHGFGATVFLVAGEVGGTSRWDRHLGGDFPLLGWKRARRLLARGVQFGSHTVSHPALCGLSNADVVREAARSRGILQERLGAGVSGLAYPYGDADAGVAHLIGACGFTFGLTAGPGHAELSHPLLLIPRIEVRGTDTLDEFAAKLSDGD